MNSSSDTSPTGCEADLVFGKRLQHPSSLSVAFFIFLIIVNLLTFPVTAVLNALVVISVQTKSRLRTHKSDVLLAFLALTDFTIGILVQPAFSAVLIMLLLNEPRGYCVLKVLRHVTFVVNASLFHLVLLTGERYIAMKHPFSYLTFVTEGRLLFASAMAWFLSISHSVLLLLSQPVFFICVSISSILSFAVISFCHVTVLGETGRHERQLAAQQATSEAREEFESNKKAFKLTSIILVLLILFVLIPSTLPVVLISYREFTPEAAYLFFSFTMSLVFLDSLLNPIVYALRLRQFRVAIIELLFRTVNIVDAEEIEMRFFGVPNAVVRVNRVKDKQDQEEQNQQNMTVENV